MALQGQLIMSLTEKLDHASANQATPCEFNSFRLPSETLAGEVEHQNFTADQETFAFKAQDAAEKLAATEKKNDDLVEKLQRCREENARLHDQVQQLNYEQQQHKNQQHDAPRSPIVGPSSPSLQKGSAGRSRGFIVGGSAIQIGISAHAFSLDRCCE